MEVLDDQGTVASPLTDMLLTVGRSAQSRACLTYTNPTLQMALPTRI
jgi:hypothetical protein